MSIAGTIPENDGYSQLRGHIERDEACFDSYSSRRTRHPIEWQEHAVCISHSSFWCDGNDPYQQVRQYCQLLIKGNPAPIYSVAMYRVMARVSRPMFMCTLQLRLTSIIIPSESNSFLLTSLRELHSVSASMGLYPVDAFSALLVCWSN